jgi:hypothetical protein
MTLKTAVINRTGDHEDNIVRWAKNLGTAKLRRKLFNLIYGRGSKPRSLKQLMTAASVKQPDAQQATNEIKHLYRKDLIARMDNDGSVKDGSRYLYLKDDSVLAHKDEIIRAADNKKLRESIPTKRTPKLSGKVVHRTVITRRALKTRKHVDVLYLMANPAKRHSLRVDAEVKAVKAEIQRSKFRDNIALHQSPAADFDDILHGLNDHNPRIVHFSGHGNAGGVAMDGGGMKRVKTKFVPFSLLGKALAATDNPPDVVVLNACQSAGARKALLGTAKAIIVMEDSVTDTAAVAFATKFYGAIASGLSLQAAFDQGCAAVEAVSLDETGIPALTTADGVNAKKLFLA